MYTIKTVDTVFGVVEKTFSSLEAAVDWCRVLMDNGVGFTFTPGE